MSTPTGISEQASLFYVPPREAGIELIHLATAIYTTESVVEKMLDRSGWPACGGRILDPSSGDGAFLVRALERLQPRPGDFESAYRVQGYEFHPGAVMDGRTRVAQCLCGLGWDVHQARLAAAVIVEQRDFLLDGPAPGRFERILGNPPYLRFARLPDIFKHLYSEVVARHAIGDLMYAFIDRCCEIMTPTTSIHLVCADRWLFNQSAADLRTAIGRRVGLAHVARLDVTTSFYRAKVRRAGTLPRVHPVEVHLSAAATAPYPITAAPISPDGYDMAPYDGPTLESIADVRVAPWLGPAGIFVVNESVAAKLTGADLVQVIDTDDIDPHTDVLRRPYRYAIRTQRDQEPSGAVREHLLANAGRMPERGKRGPWWMPPESINIPTDRPSLVVPRIARRLRAIPLSQGLLPVNHNLSLIAASDVVTLEEIRQVLTSQASQEWLEKFAPRLEGGYYSVTTTLLRGLPIPGEIAARLAPALRQAA